MDLFAQVLPGERERRPRFNIFRPNPIFLKSPAKSILLFLNQTGRLHLVKAHKGHLVNPAELSYVVQEDLMESGYGLLFWFFVLLQNFLFKIIHQFRYFDLIRTAGITGFTGSADQIVFD